MHGVLLASVPTPISEASGVSANLHISSWHDSALASWQRRDRL